MAALADRLVIQARERAFEGVIRARMPSSRLRVLPNVLIIGGMRCGTSSLFRHLAQHPQTVSSLRKETHYFASHYARGVSWYRAHFPLRWSVQRQQRDQPVAVVEASPRYLTDLRAPHRAGALLPDARIVVLLRDPVERALSHYEKSFLEGREHLAFDESVHRALAADLRPEAMQQLVEGGPGEWRRLFVYLGMYAHKLEAWMSVYPRDQLFVATSEELFAAPSDVLHRLLSFLDLPHWQPPSFDHVRNVRAMGGRDQGGSVRKMSPATRRSLATFYASHNERLFELLGRELGWQR